MRKINFKANIPWNTILVISVIFVAFILPVLPQSCHEFVFRIVYSIIYFAAIFSLEKRNNYQFSLFGATIFTEWFSILLHLPVLLYLSKGLNVIFFLIIVISLVRQIAIAKQVTSKIIFESIAVYLLVGLIYSIFIGLIFQYDPTAFSGLPLNTYHSSQGINISSSLYYVYVTLASLGYGDIVPLKPYTRSFATFIAISGQFYTTIIVAMLVGKYASQRQDKID